MGRGVKASEAQGRRRRTATMRRRREGMRKECFRYGGLRRPELLPRRPCRRAATASPECAAPNQRNERTRIEGISSPYTVFCRRPPVTGIMRQAAVLMPPTLQVAASRTRLFAVSLARHVQQRGIYTEAGVPRDPELLPGVERTSRYWSNHLSQSCRALKRAITARCRAGVHQIVRRTLIVASACQFSRVLVTTRRRHVCSPCSFCHAKCPRLRRSRAQFIALLAHAL